jgi:uncharacterized SAM-binding protein YcdF (DUF218 family)
LGAIFYKRARGFLLIVATLLYLFSTKAVGNFLLLPFEKPFNHPHVQQKVDAMVILAGGNHGKSANLTLGYSAFKRVIYGVMIAKKESLPILYSGKGLDKYNEVMSAKDTIKELNNYFDINLTETTSLSKDNFSIMYEEKSLNTYENAKFTKEMFSKLDIDNPTVYLVTSAFHLKRAIKLYNYFGFKVIPIGTDFMTQNDIKGISIYFPSMMGMFMSYHALHEWIGLLYLSLKLK